MVDVSSFSAAVNAYKNATKMGGESTPDLNAGVAENAGKPGFDDLLTESLSSAKNTAYQSESMSAKALVGDAELHELVTSVTNAELTLNTVVAVRDRVVNAYQEILKMPI
ncbi:MAG: flagellar hook-basal body complex protein FliE [Alphaproteobacteria bacterium]|nr:flagellar hook-basal body complex protein FliE [Alphaproteobacteria bacterium]